MRKLLTYDQLAERLNPFRFAAKDPRRDQPPGIYRLREPGVFGENWSLATGPVDNAVAFELAKEYDLAD